MAALAFVPHSTQRITRTLAAGRRWVVLAMLVALHAALIAEEGGNFQRAWLLVHFGLFLAWQPFFAAELELEFFSAALLFAITGATLYFLSGWMIIAWLLLLLAILGGRVFTVQAARRSRFYLVAFAYVIAILLLWAVPDLLLPEQPIPPPIALFARSVLPFMLVVLALMPIGSEDHEDGHVFDFFYSVLVFQLGVVLVLGSLAFTRFAGGHYFASVALTVLGLGVALFVLAVLWNPRRGFGGLRTYFSRYLLSVGMPFELWMRRIAELAEHENDSRRFLEEALREVASFPWVRGGSWRSPDGEGRFGTAEGHASRFAYHELEVVFHTEIRLSPALFLHMRLLAQVVGEFYEGKRREIALRQHAYLQAVHETGARLTHDVKNLLQSLYALTMAPRQNGNAELLQRQLPQLTKRLQSTLEKLRDPEAATTELPVSARVWWAEVQRLLEGSGVRLEARIEGECDVPAALFDSFVENCLDNMRIKAQREPGIAMTVCLAADAGGTELLACDTGSPVAEEVVAHLFREPIERGTGLGTGLYHIARQAKSTGFRLGLSPNDAGNVCFRLTGRRASPPAPAARS